LPGIRLPDRVKVRAELEAALSGSDFVLFVVPSQAVRAMAVRVAERLPRRRA
jgi:glycerol-3-phosphate dehydrogenase